MRHSFHVAVLVIVAATSLGARAGNAPPRDPSPETATALPRLVIEMSNDDIEWDGNWLGLWPSLSQRANSIADHGEAAIPYLREALKDPRRYVAAHVLLSQLSKEPFCFSASRYNTLRVTLWADGRTEIPDQRASIEELWRTGPFDRECLSATDPDAH